MFFLTIYTGKTYKYRKLLFVVIALAFPLPFISHYVEIRGSMTFSAEEWLSSNIPFCQLVIPMIIVPAAFTRTIIFPGQLVEGFASIGGMLVLWIGATFALGRGWCSWVCFYGGWDEGFGHLNKKPRIKIDKKWTYLPYAVLLVIVLLSAATLMPTYCEWLCPFKLITEFAEITSVKILFQTIIFVSLFAGLVVVLPLLTGKRTQCTLLCPFAAFQSFFNKINIFDIRVNTEKCKSCNKCIKICPTLSIDEKSLEKGKTRITCTKCGGCVDACPHDAVFYHIKGTKIGVRRDVARTLFLYPAFIFLGTLGGSFISASLLKILKLATTGSIV
jgi:ferredoxin-type protein NapH